MLQGPSRGEEATKKLLAIGSAAEAKTRRPRGTRENPACDKVWCAHASNAALRTAAASHSLVPQVLPFNGRRSTPSCHLPRLLRLHRPQRCESRSRSQSSGAHLCAKQTRTPRASFERMLTIQQVHPQQPPCSVQARSGPRPQAITIAFTRCGLAPPPAGKCPFARVSSQPRAAGANTTHRRVKLYAWPCPTLPSSSWLAVSRICAASKPFQRTNVGAIAQQVCGKRTRRACKLLTNCTGNIIHPAAAPQFSHTIALLCAAAPSLPSATAASAAHRTPLR